MTIDPSSSRLTRCASYLNQDAPMYRKRYTANLKSRRVISLTLGPRALSRPSLGLGCPEVGSLKVACSSSADPASEDVKVTRLSVYTLNDNNKRVRVGAPWRAREAGTTAQEHERFVTAGQDKQRLQTCECQEEPPKRRAPRNKPTATN